MFSLLSCASGLAVLCASMNCESRRAQAIPAGPPPTMTTSAGIAGRSTLVGGLRKVSMENQFQAAYISWRLDIINLSVEFSEGDREPQAACKALQPLGS